MMNDHLPDQQPIDSALNSQKSQEEKTREVLEAMKEDLAEDSEWASENIDATLELLENYMRQR